MSQYILIPYYSSTGSTETLARYIARGVVAEGLEAKVRRIPPLGREVSSNGPVAVERSDVMGCSGLIIGSPTRFGHMASAVQTFWDQTADIWYSGQLIDKPGAVFTSSQSMHGGQESTLLGMMMPLIHHGMLIVGVPYSVEALSHTQSGGGPYGASSVVGGANNNELDSDEKAICHALGSRVARIAKDLSC